MTLLHNCDDTPAASANCPHGYEGWPIDRKTAAELVDDVEQGLHWLSGEFDPMSNQAACLENTRALLSNIVTGLSGPEPAGAEDLPTEKAIAAGDMEMTPGSGVPLILAGGVRRCARCRDSWRPSTYSVLAPAGEPVCAGCAVADPELVRWQALCQITDAIDALMVSAADQRHRDVFAALLADAAQHFAAWRTEPETASGDHPDGPTCGGGCPT